MTKPKSALRAAKTSYMVLAAAWLTVAAAPKAGAQKSEARKASPPVIGRYMIPVLSGWKMTIKRRPPRTFKRMKNGAEKIYSVPRRDEVVYEKTVDNAHLSISFEAMDTAGHTVTRADILSSQQAADAVLNVMPLKTQVKAASAAAKPVNFHKLPGYLCQDTLRDRLGLLVESRDLTFGDHTNMYFQDMIIRGAAITPQARAEADKGWRNLSNGLRTFP